MSSASPLGPTEITDEYFIECRNRVLEIAAFLDRLDRVDPQRTGRDFRLEALHEALAILAGRGPEYVSRIQLLLSDPRAEPIPVLDRKSALGAYDRRQGSRTSGRDRTSE
jgi:hypothetical protein